jgi:hypothetical protein
MSHSRVRRPPDWPTLLVLALLGAVIVLGLTANGLTLLQSLVSLGFGAGVLLIAWAWQWTLRQSEIAPPLTGRQRAWNAAVFVVWLAVVGALAWWFMVAGGR